MHEGGMILIGKYLRGEELFGSSCTEPVRPAAERAPSTLLEAYRDAIETIGRCSLEISSAQGAGLLQVMEAVSADLHQNSSAEAVARARGQVHERLVAWGRGMVQHLQRRTGEVKEMLLVLARTAQHAGERDLRCARHIDEITGKLQSIARYEDIPLMRDSILAAAAEMKKSIGTILAESSAELTELRAQMAASRDRLQEAERLAAYDALTQLPNRLTIEKEITRRIEEGGPFCICLLDLDGFKAVNDKHGHLVGDEVLRQFSAELSAACRSTDVVGRWGGDELILILDCPLPSAQKQIERVSTWVCGHYTVGSLRLQVNASFGAAEHQPCETMQQLIQRADTAMYRRKRPQ